ncbi:hypothetical protein NIES4071_77420 [Calothrix sp. NIES-4071]|nr:hypothetical protein NIES4071_77420 [Calothrix sp. NIES-4071]BAZ62015.1 hypothetical protein NIES4105_77360 [Calothrix sp. NIES-4105]
MELIGFFLFCTIYSWYLSSTSPDSKPEIIENKAMDIVKVVNLNHTELIRYIDKMLGQEFESFLQCLLEKLGYIVFQTATSGDFGADLIAYKDGFKIIIQAKRYSSAVGIKAVQEALGAVNHYNANKAIVITNNSFTKKACELAASNNVELWDRSILFELILFVKRKLKD